MQHPLHFYDSFIRFPYHGTYVDTPSFQWLSMWENWRLPYTLWGGTKRMRKAGKFYLPQNPKETDEAYEIRLQRSYLFNAYRRTITSLAGQPFIKPVSVYNLPPELEYLLDDADSMGNSLSEVAHWLLVEGLNYGLYHILVDYPSADGPITLSDQREYNIRPYFNSISPLNLIGWKSERVGGIDILNEVRIIERTVEELEEYQEVPVTYVRKYMPFEVQEHKMQTNQTSQDPFGDPEIYTNTLGKVPLVTGYAERTGFMMARPPLEDLAWLNLRHWQSSSEQNNILHIMRVPILFFSGFQEGELEGAEIGAQRAIVASDPNADGKFIAGSSGPVRDGENDLKKIEEQMAKMGSDILHQKGVSRQTATARTIDKSESLSVMQSIIRDLEHSLERAFILAGEWLGVDASEVKVAIGEDLSLNPASEANPVESLSKLGLSDDDLLAEMKRRGILSDKVDSINTEQQENQNVNTFESDETDVSEEDDEEN